MRFVQSGDTGQLALLFERYNAPLFRYLLHLTGDRGLSEDLVQDVFFRVLKYAKSYDPGQSFRVWIYQMARNAHIDSTRKRRTDIPASEAMELTSAEPVPEELLARKQNVALLQAALTRLSPDKREVLVLSRFHDLRYEEIARILKCEVGTVKVRVYRALRELRDAFSEVGKEKVV
jgi:RNA polymerase sigma factor (sigma-70 family)